MTALLLLPAFLNGFPFLFDDSSLYLAISHNVYIPPDRPFFYGLLLKVLHWHRSPWPVAMAQCILVAWIIREFCIRLFSLSSPVQLIGLTTCLVVGTSLPWFAANIIPDIFTSLMILALSVTVLGWRTLPRASRIALFFVLPLSVSVHQANLLIALWTIPALCVCSLYGWRADRDAIVGLIVAAMGVVLGAFALASVHIYKEGRLSLSSSGSVFALARLLEDGPALKVLERECPTKQYKICSQLDYLREYHAAHGSEPDRIFSLSNHFLWQGPLFQLGGFSQARAEADAIVRETLTTQPLDVLRAALRNAFRQMILLRTSDVLTVTIKSKVVSRLRRVFGPSVAQAYGHSIQFRSSINVDWDGRKRAWRQTGAEFTFDWIDRAHQIVFLLVLLPLSLVLLRRWTCGSMQVYAAVFVTVFVLGNAITMGALSVPADRYQSRVIWLAALVVGSFVCTYATRLRQSRVHVERTSNAALPVPEPRNAAEFPVAG
jgi:hypothetical protein